MLAGALLVGASIPAAWECRQPEKKYRTKVEDIEMNKYCSDLQGFCTVSYGVEFEGVPGTVWFGSGTWDKTVKEGDTVDVVVRKNALPSLQGKYTGISIDDGK